MRKEIALDLRLSRVQAGLSGTDLAHLLECNKERISKLENGRARIDILEVTSLFLIYGTMPAELFQCVTHKVSDTLRTRLAEMPDEPKNWGRQHAKRSDTLNHLATRLHAITNSRYDA